MADGKQRINGRKLIGQTMVCLSPMGIDEPRGHPFPRAVYDVDSRLWVDIFLDFDDFAVLDQDIGVVDGRVFLRPAVREGDDSSAFQEGARRRHGRCVGAAVFRSRVRCS